MPVQCLYFLVSYWIKLLLVSWWIRQQLFDDQLSHFVVQQNTCKILLLLSLKQVYISSLTYLKVNSPLGIAESLLPSCNFKTFPPPPPSFLSTIPSLGTQLSLVASDRMHFSSSLAPPAFARKAAAASPVQVQVQGHVLQRTEPMNYVFS